MSSQPPDPPNDEAILTIAKIIKTVMSTASETKLGALYINCKESIPECHAIEEIGHKQTPTSMQTDNTTTLGVVKNNRMKKTKIKGHKITLFTVPKESRTISPFMVTRHKKQRGLHDKKTFSYPP